MSYKAPPYATLAFPPLSWMALMPSITMDSLTSIPPNPPEKSPNAVQIEIEIMIIALQITVNCSLMPTIMMLVMN